MERGSRGMARWRKARDTHGSGERLSASLWCFTRHRSATGSRQARSSTNLDTTTRFPNVAAMLSPCQNTPHAQDKLHGFKGHGDGWKEGLPVCAYCEALCSDMSLTAYAARTALAKPRGSKTNGVRWPWRR
jgi:hypothetical protein